MKYALMLLGCRKNEYKRMLQVQTWIRHLPPDVLWFHVVGDPRIRRSKYFSDEHLLVVKTSDKYEALTDKVSAAIRYIYEHFDVDAVVKADDKMVIHPEKMDLVVKRLMESRASYVGNTCTVEANYRSSYRVDRIETEPYREDAIQNGILLPEGAIYCFGPCYYLSRLAMMVIAEYDFSGLRGNPYSFYEDVTMGYVLNSVCIVPKCCHLYSEKFEDFRDRAGESGSAIFSCVVSDFDGDYVVDFVKAYEGSRQLVSVLAEGHSPDSSSQPEAIRDGVGEEVHGAAATGGESHNE